MRYPLAVSLLSAALAGCSLAGAKPTANTSAIETGQLAAQRGSGERTAAAPAQQRSAAAQGALDLDRIGRKLTVNVAEARQPQFCSERGTSMHAEAHATWGDTMQDLQRRKACAVAQQPPAR